MVGNARGKGVAPRAVQAIFKALQLRPYWSMEVSVLEIYNERVRDLFAPDPDRPDLDVVESEEGTHVGVMGKGGEGLERVGNTSAEGLQERRAGQQGRSVSPRRMILLVAHRPAARLVTSLKRLCLLVVAGADDLRFVVIVLLK